MLNFQKWVQSRVVFNSTPTKDVGLEPEAKLYIMLIDKNPKVRKKFIIIRMNEQ